MRLARQNTAPCGHPNPHQLTIVHAGWWGCPFCAAVRFFEQNQRLMCAQARQCDDDGRQVEARAVCEMALACGPCPAPGRCGLSELDWLLAGTPATAERRGRRAS